MSKRTVWILGAGFSRSLGGPLLLDLLSAPTNNFVRALYVDNEYIGEPDGPRLSTTAVRVGQQSPFNRFTSCGERRRQRVGGFGRTPKRF